MGLSVESVGAVQSGSQELSRDLVFATLSNARRRYVLHYLKRHGGPATIRQLAEQIAAWENGTTMAEVTYKQRKRVYTSLHQTHLPKLADAGIIESERSWEAITLSARADELDVYLEVVPKDDLPWSDFYLGLAGVGLALVAGLWMGAYPLTLFSDLAWAGLFAVVLFVVAAVHAYDARRHLLGGTETPTDAGAARTDPSATSGDSRE
ncbi:helix-turn-helix domain-containing protein [Salinirubrum litoreum]|uniref:Helix-turn-helix domain-containing protein n=1 Tax=Salinirubrum litoreum TaxID=1126234 RepID=A0ABD5RD12_9EURY|nr:helix-turn-helix domain-containing protein [Salinirubrum litoreum]